MNRTRNATLSFVELTAYALPIRNFKHYVQQANADSIKTGAGKVDRCK
jgi:hypothetical protein